MRQILWLQIMVIILLLPTFLYAGMIAPARVKTIEGEIYFRTPDSDESFQASVNTPLEEGDMIWSTQGSRVEIQLADGTVIRLDGNSQLDLIANEDGFTHLHLSSGKLYVRTTQNMPKDSLQIDADDTTVIPSARTRLRIDMLPNSQEDVAIFKGSAYVQGSGTRTRVRAGEHIILDDGHQEIYPLNPPDTWEEWNKALDLIQSRSSKAANPLPDELKNYANELDSNGKWEQVPEYGLVWRPTVVVIDDWAPYRSGRWIWKGDDYVWISYESWGWVPYHFGRWAVVSGFGWCWVPPARGDIYWGPGYVGWHRNGNDIGWVPLAPGETFYGRRYYGKNSINISTTYVNQTAVAYRNKNFRGGFTIVSQNDFLQGRTVTPSHSRDHAVSVSVGSPQIKPLRETRMPLVKQTPPRIIIPRSNRTDSSEMRMRFPRVIPSNEYNNRQPPAALTTPHGEPAPRNRVVPHPVAEPERPVHIEQPSRPGYRNQENHTRPVPKQEIKQKRVWKITTKEQVDEKGGKEEKEHKDRRGK